MGWIRQLVSRRRRYDDILVSVEEHIVERTEELMSRGMPRKQAEQAARRAFGNVGLIEQRSREVWQWPALESVLGDVRVALRRLGKSPGFAATVLLTLAIGIGANTTVFSVVDNVLLKPLPYPGSDRLVSLWLNAKGGGLSNFTSGLQLSPSMFFTFSDHNQSFETMGVWAPRTSNVTGLAQPEEVRTALLSDGVLQTLAIPAALGRWFGQQDEDPRGARTAILSYGYWQRRFGGDRAVIGRSIEVDSQTREIVGVMPRGFRMVDQDFDLLIPLAPDRAHQKLAPFFLNGIARLKPGVTIAKANADVSRLIGVWMDSWTNGPGTNPHYYETWRITPDFRSLKKQVVGEVDQVLWIVMSTVGLVLLIAAVNIANLLMVRAESRQQELTVRAALGAGRARIARELLTESVMLGFLGGVLSLGVAYGGLRLLKAFGPTELPRLHEVRLDGFSLGFTLLLSIASGVLFGSIPALKYARAKASDALSGSSRTSSSGRARNRSRSVLVVSQVAMAMVLLVSAVLMIRSVLALRDVQPGFRDAGHVQTMRITIPQALIADAEMVTRVQNEIADKLAAIPDVSGVGFAASVPLDGFDANWDQILVEGQNLGRAEPPMRLYDYVSPGYFAAMGTRLVAGRDFTWTDNYTVRDKVMVSENFARETWGSAANAVGKRVREFSGHPWNEVIGVVEDVHQHGVNEKAPVIIYWPVMWNNPYGPKIVPDSQRFVTFAIHSERAGGEGFLEQVRQAVWTVNANLPVAGLSTMGETYEQSLSRTSFTLVMLAIAGSMALALGIIGIYGVISYAISQRTREIGIRMALGAQRGELKWMFVRSALLLTMLGIGVGICAAAGLTQAMRALLFGIGPLDPLTYVAVPLVLGVAAALASYLPARRAAAVNPSVALRNE
ncbi:ABC transporter permease [Acidobacteria bacterium AB60]|nr:ABC transporter permease [Acidobacteria bacterium AB60]